MTTAHRKLWRFPGGLHLDEHKAKSTRASVIPARLPKRLVLPLRQHIGAAAKPLVKVAQQVYKGQLLAQADGYVSANLHAPSSGRVTAIEERPVAHPSGMSAPCIVLDTDGREQWGELPKPLVDYLAVEPVQIRRRLRNAGIVGLGGAAFPAAVKLNPGPNIRINLLILNGAECEPYITCDDMLMREHAQKIVSGLMIMRHALQVEDAIIGIEDNKSEAIAAMTQALNELRGQAEHVEIRRIPTIYPAGGEKQLVRVLTGREVPSDGIPAEIGMVCHNVGTAAAIHDAVIEGRPLISRYISVTGDSVNQPRVLEALIGTMVSDLVQQCGGYSDDVKGLIMGGPMMGFALRTDQVPIVKGSNCVLAMSSVNWGAPQSVMPCIRCGACAEVCPANLLPQQLYWYARGKDFDKVQDYNLFDCIECGCCAAVCPSHIPLVQYYRFAKTEIWAREREKQKADLARQRHDFHLARLQREKDERAAKMRKKKAALHKGEAAAAQDPKKAAIEAAVARAKAKAASESQDVTT